MAFHAPALSVLSNESSTAVVQRAFEVGVQSTLAISALFSEQGFVEDKTPFLKPSLLSEVLRTPNEDLFYVNSANQAGIWDIWVTLPDTGPMGKKSFETACLRQISWSQDRNPESFNEYLLRATLDRSSVIVNALNLEPVCNFSVSNQVELERDFSAIPIGTNPLLFLSSEINLSDLEVSRNP